MLKILEQAESGCYYISMVFEYSAEKQKFLDLFEKIDRLLPDSPAKFVTHIASAEGMHIGDNYKG